MDFKREKRRDSKDMKSERIKFWTVQRKSVLKTIENNGIFFPNVDRSTYIAKYPNRMEVLELYRYMLNAFNENNGTDYKGLIFSFMYSNPEQDDIRYFQSIDEFVRIIRERGRGTIEPLWKELIKNDSVILELEYAEDFNPIYIDINDFQFLMPPIGIMGLPFEQQYAAELMKTIDYGVIIQSLLYSGIIQAHSGYIKKENIINVYDMFEIVPEKR